MTNGKNSLRLWLWVITCIFLTIYFFDYGWSLSTDIVNHYEVIANVYKHWHVSASTGLIYMPYGYIFAATLGTFLGSALAGMQWAVILSLLGLWSAIGFALLSLPKRAAFLAGFGVLVLLCINWFSIFKFSFYGSEIIGNFFFAQLLSEAIAVVVLVWAMYGEQQAVNPWLRYLLLASGVLLVENVHLLASVELLGLLALLVFIDSFFPKKLELKPILLRLLLVLITVAILLINPAFSVMRSISLNNGGIALNHISNLFEVGVLCALVVCFSCFLIIKWMKLSEESRKNCLLLKYVGLFGIAASGLCVFQMLVLIVGEGSEYACKKYGFGLTTLILIDLALILSILFKPAWFSESKNELDRPLIKIFQCTFVPILLLVVFFIGPIYSSKIYSIASLVRWEKSIEAYRNTLMEKEAPNKSDYVVGLTDEGPGTIDFMMSTIVLNAPPTDNVRSVIARRPFPEPEKVGYLITLEGKKWDIPVCRKHISPDSLVLLDGACVLARLKENK